MNDHVEPTDHQGRAIDFGRTAADYDRFRPGFPANFFARLADMGWIAQGQRALDLGTGTGSLALGFAAFGLNVTGLDIAPELLEVARKDARERDLSVQFSVGRAEATGAEGEAFDLVTAGQCWWWFDSDETLRETKRILVKGGRLIICSFSYLPLPGSIAELTEELILRYNPGWQKAGWRGVHPEQVRALDEGHFRHVESFSYAMEVPFSHEAWRGRIRTCNGMGSALLSQEVERFDRELAEVLAREAPGALHIPHRIFATSGLKG